MKTKKSSFHINMAVHRKDRPMDNCKHSFDEIMIYMSIEKPCPMCRERLLKTENERLKNELEDWTNRHETVVGGYNKACEANEELEDKNERLKGEIERLEKCWGDAECRVNDLAHRLTLLEDVREKAEETHRFFRADLEKLSAYIQLDISMKALKQSLDRCEKDGKE